MQIDKTRLQETQPYQNESFNLKMWSAGETGGSSLGTMYSGSTAVRSQKRRTEIGSNDSDFCKLL